MATTAKKHVLLLVVLLSPPLSAGSDQGNQSIETDNAAASGWDYTFWLPKFERQASTRDGDYYGEWAGLIVVSNQRDSFWLTTKGSTQAGETDSFETRLFYSRSRGDR